MTIELGQWDMVHGIRLQNYKNRWDRRTDLKGAELVNSLASYGRSWSELVRDTDGNVVGSKGELQNILFYITNRLNLTIKTVEMKRAWSFMAENGLGLLDFFKERRPTYPVWALELRWTAVLQWIFQ